MSDHVNLTMTKDEAEHLRGLINLSVQAMGSMLQANGQGANISGETAELLILAKTLDGKLAAECKRIEDASKEPGGTRAERRRAAAEARKKPANGAAAAPL